MNRLRAIFTHFFGSQDSRPSELAGQQSMPTKLFLHLQSALLEQKPKILEEAIRKWDDRQITSQDIQQIQQDLSLKGKTSSELILEIASFLLFSNSFLQDSNPSIWRETCKQFLLNIKVFTIFLDVCADPKERDAYWDKIVVFQDAKGNKETLFHMLARTGDLESIEIILGMLNPEQRERFLAITDKNGENVIHLLCYPSYMDFEYDRGFENFDKSVTGIFEMLSETQKKRLINSKNAKGESPVLIISQKWHWNKLTQRLMNELVKNGLNLLEIDHSQNTILHFLSITGGTIEAIRDVLTELIPTQKQQLINAKNSRGETPLLLACRRGDPEVVRILIENGANLFDVDLFGNNVFHMLAERTEFMTRNSFLNMEVAYSDHMRVYHLVFSNLSDEEKRQLLNEKNIYGNTFFHLLINLSINNAIGLIPSIIKLTYPYAPKNETLDIIISLIDQGKLDESNPSFYNEILNHKLEEIEAYKKLIKNKLPIYSDIPSLDKQVSSLFKMFLQLHLSDLNLIALLKHLIMNPKLSLDPENLQKLTTAYLKYKGTPHEHLLLKAIATCEDINLFTSTIEAIDLLPTYDKKQFLALSLDKQKAMLSRFVVFRDRKGLALGSLIIKQASENPQLVSPELITLALGLIEKIEILFNPDEDEGALISLILALVPYLKTHPEMTKVLSQAVFSFAKVDQMRLKKQYRSGVFHIFLLAKKMKSEELLLSSIRALSVYSYDPSREEDKEIIQALLKLAEEKNLSLPMQRELALLLSTICEKEALLTAWKLIQGAAWDHYQPWEGIHETLKHEQDYYAFNFYSDVWHQNRENMRKKILDLLGEYHKQEYQPEVDRIYGEFQKNPSAYRFLQQFEQNLKKIPEIELRYLDPLFLPADSFVFRGIGLNALGMAHAFMDLFMRGVGNCELAKGFYGVFSIVGQYFFALDKRYARYYAGTGGVLMVVDGNHINQAILRRRARQETNETAMHYVLYDTISHEHFKAIYVPKDLKKEILALRDADPTSPPTQLKYFAGLDKEELALFIKALKHDPHQICNKIKEADDLLECPPAVVFNGKNVIPEGIRDFIDEPETDFDKVVKENVKRKLMRDLMEEKYASDLSNPKARRVSSKL